MKMGKINIKKPTGNLLSTVKRPKKISLVQCEIFHSFSGVIDFKIRYLDMNWSLVFLSVF